MSSTRLAMKSRMAGINVATGPWWALASSFDGEEIAADGLPHHALEERRLVLEVEVDRRLAEPGARRDVVQPVAAKPFSTNSASAASRISPGRLAGARRCFLAVM